MIEEALASTLYKKAVTLEPAKAIAALEMIVKSYPATETGKTAKMELARLRMAHPEVPLAAPIGLTDAEQLIVRQAAIARRAGRRRYQVDLPLSRTDAKVVPMFGAYSPTTDTADATPLLEAVEKEGWHLEHVGYVYRLKGSSSRDKFLASGQQEAYSGELIGIYLFLAACRSCGASAGPRFGTCIACGAALAGDVPTKAPTT